MKCAIFASLFLVLVSTACQKESLNPGNNSETGSATTLKATISNWEPLTPTGWQSSTGPGGQIIYRYNLGSPGVMPGATVLAFIKGYSFSDPAVNKPMRLPFSFFSPSALSNGSYNWEIEKTANGITLAIRMEDAMKNEFIGSQRDIQVQLVTIPAAFFTRNHTDETAVSNMSYGALTTRIAAAL